jgi:hypothetical protein
MTDKRPLAPCHNQPRDRARREEIINEIGCNAYGRLQCIMRVLDWNRPNRDAKVRRELLALLKFFPRKKR